MTYIPGDPWGLCPRCGFRFRLSTFREEWTGIRVCEHCWDPKHPQLDIKAVKEPPMRLDVLPEPADHTVSIGEITADDL